MKRSDMFNALIKAQDELKKCDPQYVQRLESQSSAYSYMMAGAAVFTVVMSLSPLYGVPAISQSSAA